MSGAIVMAFVIPSFIMAIKFLSMMTMVITSIIARFWWFYIVSFGTLSIMITTMIVAAAASVPFIRDVLSQPSKLVPWSIRHFSKGRSLDNVAIE
jgi:hypothetical protein